MKDAKALTITYLTKTSISSLNGSDKEADNISSIKKITRGVEQFPYGSSQWIRRALREQLATMGWELSEGVAAKIEKGAATTKQNPDDFIDDDLFGFMGTEKGEEGAKGSATKRTSPVRVSPLISFDRYSGDLDFGTNYMGVEAGGTPNIFETEIHSGIYRGTILVELDRVGCGEGFKKDLEPDKKAERVNALLKAIKNLWSTGRQTRFLADISPKFVAAALMRVKNPIFLETVIATEKGIDFGLIQETLKDYQQEIIESVIGAKKEMFPNIPEDVVSIGEAFKTMERWISDYYKMK
jgi:CRISPR-associated protein Cst2